MPFKMISDLKHESNRCRLKYKCLLWRLLYLHHGIIVFGICQIHACFEYIFKMHVCLGILPQTKRKSGFGASDELSSEEEEGVQPVEVILPTPHQERHPATTWPIPAPLSSVRKRSLKSNSKPTLRPQVNLTVTLCVRHVPHKFRTIWNNFL